MKRHSITVFLASATLALGLSTLTVSAQGPLAPPGPPAPMMKTLQQLEPRTDVMTLPGDVSHQHIINAPGSYYLTTNLLGAASENGIGIFCDNVTLDLNGFALLGRIDAYTGINIGAQTNIAIYNGFICGWNGAGVRASTSCRYEKLMVANNGDVGILAGPNSLLTDCTAVSNSVWASTAGFQVGPRSTLTRCKSLGNQCFGFRAESECLFVNCSAHANAADGFFTGDFCSFRGCVAANNNGDGISARQSSVVKDCMCVLNGVHGIDFGDSGNDSTVKGCSAHQNNCGIVFSSHCVAEDNLCSGNGSGIQAVMDQNRIDSNHTMYNNSYGINDYHGIDVFGALNLVVRNSSDDINYVSSPNISLGPIVGLGQGQIRSDTGWENFSLFGTYR